MFQDNSPALTFAIAQAYFENNLSGQVNDFTLADGFYWRTIPENELELGFDDDTDGKLYQFILSEFHHVLDITLSYTIETESHLFQANANTGIR